MLRDMAPERFEKGIVIPYLQKIEDGFNGESPKFDQYFRVFCREIYYEEIIDGTQLFRFEPNDKVLLVLEKLYNSRENKNQSLIIKYLIKQKGINWIFTKRIDQG